jgi:ABC-2 type transport system ATP-binding protein
VTEPAVRTHGLVKSFGAFTAVDHVDLTVSRGEIFGFLGPNGAGKTTLIRMLTGNMLPSGGRAEVLGCDVVREAEALRRRIGYMSQRFALFEDLTVDENLRFYAGVYDISRDRFEERRRSVLEMAGLVGRGSELTANLSVGFKQRLALGAATIHEPELIFLDEPTSGVDPVARRQFWELLYDLAEQGVTLFVTTHYMDEATHCHRLGFIYDGRLIATGSPAEIRAALTDCIVEIDVADVDAALDLLEDTEGVREFYLSGVRLHANLGERSSGCERSLMQSLRAGGLEVRAVTRVEPTIEDVFVHLVARERARTEVER